MTRFETLLCTYNSRCNFIAFFLFFSSINIDRKGVLKNNKRQFISRNQYWRLEYCWCQYIFKMTKISTRQHFEFYGSKIMQFFSRKKQVPYCQELNWLQFFSKKDSGFNLYNTRSMKLHQLDSRSLKNTLIFFLFFEMFCHNDS